MAVHVVPINDAAAHELETTCECGPRVDFDHGMLVVHKSFDEREFLEYDGLPASPEKLWVVLQEAR